MFELNEEIKELLTNARKWELVGSRVTCNPPPVDTDQDVLVYVDADDRIRNPTR